MYIKFLALLYITIAKDQSLKPNNFLSICLDAVKAKFPNTFFGWHYKLPHEQQLLENEEYKHLQLSKEIQTATFQLCILFTLVEQPGPLYRARLGNQKTFITVKRIYWAILSFKAISEFFKKFKTLLPSFRNLEEKSPLTNCLLRNLILSRFSQILNFLEIV